MSIRLVPSRVPYDSNIYLVSGEHPLIVDAGTGQDSDAVIATIRRASPKPPEMIVATHCHYDHAGGLKDLVDAFGCPVYAGRLDAPYIRSGDPELTVGSLFGDTLRTVEVNDLAHGDFIDTGEHRFKVLETPGHTPGSICLYEESTGSLISGDTLFLTGYGRTDFAGGSMSAMRSSLGMLRNIDIRGLFPGHGSACERYSPEYLERVLMMAGV
ncbi:MAG: MBL fold metallo-hydrolase [Thermoplasmata archaeon]|nr:MBL fold metallo-hydrolase [Thermoplasmata archaeon]